MKRLTLRSRLALLSAVAVAVAIAGVALLSWFSVRTVLYRQLDDVAGKTGPPPISDVTKCSQLPAYHPPPGTNGDPSGGQGAKVMIELIDPGGTACNMFGPPTAKVLPTADDLAFAAARGGGSYSYDGTTVDGRPVRIQVATAQSGVTYLKYQPLTDVRNSLSSLAWMLLLVSGLGIAGAAGAGVFVARRSLRPVDHLTRAVEYVARTENLTVRIPVHGDDEIARLSRAFNKMTRSLSASRDEQRRLIDDAGHELRTPLTSLRTTIDLLIRSDETGRPLPEHTRTQLLTGARTQMRELTVLIRDLLDLSAPEPSRTAGAQLEPVDFEDIVERAVERVRPRGAALASPVAVSASLTRWVTRGDEAGLERAVVNLLDNAVKFSPPGGTVEVVLRGGRLTVRDHGPGIEAAELPHVFERFWRSPSARAMPGSGLGLAIAARSAKEAGGKISLGPAPDGGTGTVATMTLPGFSNAHLPPL